MSDLETLVGQFNDLQNQITEAQGQPCCCERLQCNQMSTLLNSSNADLTVEKVNDIITGESPKCCAKCISVRLLYLQLSAIRSSIMDLTKESS